MHTNDDAMARHPGGDTGCGRRPADYDKNDLLDEFIFTIFCQAAPDWFKIRDGRPLRPIKDITISRQFAAFWSQFGEEGMNSLPTASRQQCEALLRDENDPSTISAWRRKLEGALYHTVGKCFFYTASGFIGLCNIGTKAGDSIVLFNGCKAPYAIREQQVQESTGETVSDGVKTRHWKCIGSCFVNAWLDGKYVDLQCRLADPSAGATFTLI